MTNETASDNDDRYCGAIILAWEGVPPPDLPSVETAVTADIRDNLGGLERPEDLCFHHVELSEDEEGPSVFVSGKKGSGAFHCTYSAETR